MDKPTSQDMQNALRAHMDSINYNPLLDAWLTPRIIAMFQAGWSAGIEAASADAAAGEAELEDVLDDYSVQEHHTIATMRDYMARYPQFAADIAELHILIVTMVVSDAPLDAHDHARIDEAWRKNFVCDVPPAGWTCSRLKGHDGPCAASLAQPAGQVKS